jgi:hypothetical protein
MLDVFNIAKPQNCDIQIFYGNGSNPSSAPGATWIKPRGVSHVYMLLIGAGGYGDNTTGGGSGAVTVFYTAAQNIPDVLRVSVPLTNLSTRVTFPTGDIIQARGAVGITGGPTTTAPFFAAQGFYQSIAGQNGSASFVNASSTTFLAGGGAGGNDQTSNYGYVTRTDVNKNGFLLMQPIIVGMGGMGTGRGGIGCGAGVSVTSGVGSSGMALIASW